jgi:hypothetical protein
VALKTPKINQSDIFLIEFEDDITTCGCKFTKPGANYSKENNFETNPTFGVSCV